MKLKLEFKGLNELNRKLSKVSAQQTKTLMNEIVLKRSGDLQRVAMQKAPVDTGFLKRSIQLEHIPAITQGRTYATAEYAIFQELGTRYQPGTPFMRPAFYQVYPLFEQDMGKVVERLLK